MVKTEAEIVIATQALDSLAIDKVTGTRLVVSGPGEYEAGGISITGKDVKTGISYQILEQSKILLVASTSISSVPDDEEYDCLVVKVTGEFKDETLASINAKCVVLYGDLSLATVNSENQEKLSKINIKKTAEVAGKTFLLI